MKGNDKKITYTKFEKKELDIFCEILDVEKTGIINLADLEATSKNLGFESMYQDIRNLLKSKIDMKRGGIPVAVLKEYLMANEKTFDQEMDEIFDYFDYDKKGTLSKHKLKIIASELSKLVDFWPWNFDLEGSGFVPRFDFFALLLFALVF